jgi:hypothetical protein
MLRDLGLEGRLSRHAAVTWVALICETGTLAPYLSFLLGLLATPAQAFGNSLDGGQGARLRTCSGSPSFLPPAGGAETIVYLASSPGVGHDRPANTFTSASRWRRLCGGSAVLAGLNEDGGPRSGARKALSKYPFAYAVSC